MLAHYFDLVRQFWKRIVAAALGTGALACMFSIVLLEAMPLYRSSVTVNMQPSEEALRFNNAFLGVSQFNPATIITQAHIERILSRPVAERALDILVAENDGPLTTDTPNPFDLLKAALWRNWTLLNYGYHESVSERDEMVNELMEATDLDVVAGSYIMKLEVTYDDPELAARAANALASAYIDVASREFAEEAAAVDAALAKLQAEKQTELARHLERRRDLNRSSGFESPEEGRAILLAMRTEARQVLAASERELAALQERLDQTSEIDDSVLAELRAEVSSARSLVASRADALAASEAGLRSLDSTEAQLIEIDQRIREVESDLAELQRQRVTTELARESRLHQVRIINDAAVPIYPAFPKVFANTLTGTLLGGVLALALIASLDVMDTRVRTAEDLRDAVGARTLLTVSRRLVAQARRYRQTGRKPGRKLQAFVAAMGRCLMTQGGQRWPERRIYVTAFGEQSDVDRLFSVIDSAVRCLASDGGNRVIEPNVVLLPEFSRLTDWSPYRDSILVIGVPSGKVDRDEVERTGDAAAQAEAAAFMTILT